jgi:hypothetical protein
LYPVTIIKEPEAAALYTLHDIDFTLSPGDAFVICDAGGGTVDLISYEVEAMSPRLKLKELVPGSGAMAGSLGLNKRFEEAVKNLIGETAFTQMDKNAWLKARTQFDREIKPAFNGKPQEEYSVTFPMADLMDDPSKNLVTNTWTMTGWEHLPLCIYRLNANEYFREDLKVIFRPIIHDIVRLVSEKVNKVKLKRPGKEITASYIRGYTYKPLTYSPGHFPCWRIW